MEVLYDDAGKGDYQKARDFKFPPVFQEAWIFKKNKWSRNADGPKNVSIVQKISAAIKIEKKGVYIEGQWIKEQEEKGIDCKKVNW